jgi:DNA-binding IclR family transcriptional regulator
MPRIPIQQKLDQVIAFIQRYNAQKGFPPSLQDIANGCNLSRSTAFDYRRRLVEQGRLSYRPRRARSLRVLDDPQK